MKLVSTKLPSPWGAMRWPFSRVNVRRAPKPLNETALPPKKAPSTRPSSAAAPPPVFCGNWRRNSERLGAPLSSMSSWLNVKRGAATGAMARIAVPVTTTVSSWVEGAPAAGGASVVGFCRGGAVCACAANGAKERSASRAEFIFMWMCSDEVKRARLGGHGLEVEFLEVGVVKNGEILAPACSGSD